MWIPPRQNKGCRDDKTTLKFTEFHLFFSLFSFLPTRRRDGWRYLIIQLCLIVLKQRQTNVSALFFLLFHQWIGLYQWTQQPRNCSMIQQ